MGTRADFYDSKGPDAEWLGSIAWDGYPGGIDKAILAAKDGVSYQAACANFIKERDDGTTPDLGWPWPWKNSGTTDYAYAFNGGKVWISCFGSAWFEEGFEDWDEENECEIEPPGPPAQFPDMSGQKHSAAAGSKRSGIMTISVPTDS